MKPTTKDEFYKRVGPLDVQPVIQPGPYPYTSLWKLRGYGQTIGKSMGRTEGGLTVTDYFIVEDGEA